MTVPELLNLIKDLPEGAIITCIDIVYPTVNGGETTMVAEQYKWDEDDYAAVSRNSAVKMPERPDDDWAQFARK
jgi:hypothetical protein